MSHSGDAAYRELRRKRSSRIWPLSLGLIALYGFSLFLMTIGSNLGTQPLVPGSAWNVAVFTGIAVILSGMAITTYYVLWANRVLDPLIKQAKMDQARSDKGSD